jgi:hypothetical protein
MNELEMLREAGAQTRLPEPAELAAARARVLAGVTRGRESTRSRRLVLGGVTVAAAAAITAAVLVVTRAPAAPPVITARLTAEQVLDRAAAAALKQPAVRPRPDQFVYHKAYDSGRQQQSWISVDGTRNGLITEDIGLRETVKGCAAGHRCTPVPDYFPSIPATRAGILTWLGQLRGVDIPDTAAGYGSAAADALDFVYLTPAQQHALYRFLAESHKFTAVPFIRDALGRPGVGVAWTIDDVRFTLIFDAKNYAYLGFSEGLPHSGAAIEKIAIVDRVGELPR